MRRNLTKIEILRNKNDINRIFDEGKKYSSSGMRLISLNNNLGFDRIIIIPKKHFGTAVERNKARRRAKEVFRNYSKRHIEDKQNSKDYVLLMYPGKVSDFSLLESNFVSMLDRSNQK